MIVFHDDAAALMADAVGRRVVAEADVLDLADLPVQSTPYWPTTSSVSGPGRLMVTQGTTRKMAGAWGRCSSMSAAARRA